MINLHQLAYQANIKYVGQNPCYIQGMATDSRQVTRGDLFVAIVANRDGHDFIDSALANGATALLVEKEVATDRPQLIANDSVEALGKLAQCYRSYFNIPVIAITGTCGKTSTKDLLASVLSQNGRVTYTQGNLNNQIGVPKTLFTISQNDDYIVVEIGTNGPGEISYLTKIVKPDIALITNVSASHLEGLKSIQGVLQEKTAIFRDAPHQSLAIINRDDEMINQYINYLQRPYLTYSTQIQDATIYQNAHIKTDQKSQKWQIVLPGNHKSDLVLPFLGDHHLNNALAVTTICYTLGIAYPIIQKGIYKAQINQGRFNVEWLDKHVRLIDDTYNASVPSVLSAIKFMHEQKGKRLLILTHMSELGEHAEHYHNEVGRYLSLYPNDQTYLYGDTHMLELMMGQLHFKDMALVCNTKAKVYHHVRNEINAIGEPITILVKGTRTQHMEEVVNWIKNDFHD